MTRFVERARTRIKRNDGKIFRILKQKIFQVNYSEVTGKCEKRNRFSRESGIFETGVRVTRLVDGSASRTEKVERPGEDQTRKRTR